MKIIFIIYNFKKLFSNIGQVESIGDGIINTLGLQNAANGEMINNYKEKIKEFIYNNKESFPISNIEAYGNFVNFLEKLYIYNLENKLISGEESKKIFKEEL